MDFEDINPTIILVNFGLHANSMKFLDEGRLATSMHNILDKWQFLSSLWEQEQELYF
jgi:hypothetical protein